jgi:hypothetical protein
MPQKAPSFFPAFVLFVPFVAPKTMRRVVNAIVGVILLAFAVSVNAQKPVPDRIRREAEEFRLEDVRLLDGPFKHAMTRDAEYLLRLDADRLLSGFRKEAGLTPKAAAYGGWESMTIGGHSLGHYLSACEITIRFQAQPGNTAGGFYGLRMLRK